MSLNRKKILLTANSTWYLYHFRKSTIKEFVKQGFDVYCLAPDDSFKFQLLKLDVTFIQFNLSNKSVNPVLEVFSTMRIFFKLLKLKPDYVFNFTIKMNIYSGICCVLLKIPYANNVSGLGTAFLHNSWQFRLARKFYGIVNKKADKVFMQNSEDRTFFLEQGLAKEQQVILLPGSGVDVNHFKYHELDMDKPFTFIMIARLIADKGVREYVDAARQVKLEKPNARFLLIGPSDVDNKTAITDAEIRGWQQESVIEYLGELDDIRPCIQSSHILVLPSYREGMPRAVLEAASIGRPAIVSDVAGCRQAIKPLETGWLCEVKNSHSLANAMLLALTLAFENLQTMSHNCRAYMEECFNETLVVDAYIQCFKAYKEQ